MQEDARRFFVHSDVLRRCSSDESIVDLDVEVVTSDATCAQVDELMELLRRVPILAREVVKQEALLRSLASRCLFETFDEGQHVVSQGEKGECCDLRPHSLSSHPLSDLMISDLTLSDVTLTQCASVASRRHAS